MSKTFYETDSDFVIKLDVSEDMSLSLAFPETRLTVKNGSLLNFLNENTEITNLLLSSVVDDIESLINQGYNNFLCSGHNLILGAVINLETYEVNWSFPNFMSDKSREISMAITSKYVNNYVGVMG